MKHRGKNDKRGNDKRGNGQRGNGNAKPHTIARPLENGAAQGVGWALATLAVFWILRRKGVL